MANTHRDTVWNQRTIWSSVFSGFRWSCTANKIEKKTTALPYFHAETNPSDLARVWVDANSAVVIYMAILWSSPYFEPLHNVAHMLKPYFAIKFSTQNLTLWWRSRFAMSQTVALNRHHSLQCCETWPKVSYLVVKCRWRIWLSEGFVSWCTCSSFFAKTSGQVLR